MGILERLGLRKKPPEPDETALAVTAPSTPPAQATGVAEFRWRLPGEKPQEDILDDAFDDHLTRHKFRCPCCSGSAITTIRNIGLPRVSTEGDVSNHLLAVAAVCGTCGYISLFSSQVLQPIVAFTKK